MNGIVLNAAAVIINSLEVENLHQGDVDFLSMEGLKGKNSGAPFRNSILHLQSELVQVYS